MQNDEWVILMEAANETEADLVCGLLDSYEIPVEKRYSGPFAGLKVIFGQELGVDIMVPSKFLEWARDLIKSEE